jgi:xyloglucan-specific exo-beta-1,4-glucanase
VFLSRENILRVIVLLIIVFSCNKNTDGPDSDNPTLSGPYNWGNVTIGGGGFVTGIVTCPTQKNLLYIRTDVGGAYRWIEESQTWKPITDFVGPDETSLLGIQSIAIDPGNPCKVYIAAGTEYFNGGYSCILISEDYGDSFTRVDVTSMFKFHGNCMGRQNGERLAVDPNNGNILFCGTRSDGLWKSIDSGRDWARISSFPVRGTSNGNGICFIQFDSSDGTPGTATQTIYAGVSSSGSANLFVSHDGGQAWTAIDGAPTNYMPQRCLLSNGKLYVSYADTEGPWNCTRGSIMLLNIITGEWKNITPEPNTAFSGITTNADNSVLVATSLNKWINQGNGAFGDEIYKSSDDGETWTELFQNEGSTLDPGECPWIASYSLHWCGDVKIDPFNAGRAFIISGNGVFMTSNLTSTNPKWVFTSQGLEETVPLDLISIPGGPLVSVVGDYDGFKHPDINKFPEKAHFPSIGTSTGIAYASLKPNFVVRVGGSKENRAMYYSEDYGDTWKRVQTTGVGKYNGKIAVSADAQCILWSPGGEVYYTRDKQNWSVSTGISGDLSPVSDYVNPNIFYAYSGSGKFYKSFDQGVSFTTSLTSFTGGSPIIRAVPDHEGHVLVAAKGFGLWLTKDYGFSFEKITTVEDCEAVGTGKAASGNAYPVIFIYGRTVESSKTGPYRSDDFGVTWVRVNDDDHQFGGLANGRFIIGDNNVFGRVYMSTAGRGIVYGDIL